MIRQVGQRLVAGFFHFEISGRGQQRGIGATALQRGGAAADIGAHRNPLHVARLQAGLAQQRDR